MKQGDKISYREHLEKTYNPLILQIRRMGKPVIAAVNGPCAGAAFGVALACDLRIARSSAYFVVGFGGIALAPDSGVSLFLPVYIGLGRAQEYFYSNKPITAQQAMEWGMVNQVGGRRLSGAGHAGCGQPGHRSAGSVCRREEGFQSRHPAQSGRSAQL